MNYFGKDSEIAVAMSDAAESGGSLAWRLLATLEGGSLLLAASALLAYTARGRPHTAPPRKVALTDTTSDLGRALKRGLEARGCVVSAVTSDATVAAESELFDALVVVGSEPKADGLDGITDLVSEDVFSNIKLLENLASRVKRGGSLAWACAGAGRTLGSFDTTAAAFDALLQASLVHVAQVFQCVPVWVGRCQGSERAAERLVNALFAQGTHDNRFSLRNAAHTVGEYLYRWLKIIT